eukprot:149375_1
MNSDACGGMDIDALCRELIDEVKGAKDYFQIQQIDWRKNVLFCERFCYIKPDCIAKISYKHAGITEEEMIEQGQFYDELNEQLNCELSWDSDFEDDADDPH